MTEEWIEEEIIRVINILDELSKIPRHKGKGIVDKFYNDYLDTVMREYAKTGERT